MWILKSNRPKHLLISLVIAVFSWEMAIGAEFGAEFKDYQYSKFDSLDMAANFIGVAIGIAIRVLFNKHVLT